MKTGTGDSLTVTVKRPRLGLAAAFGVLPAAPYILRSSTLPLQVSEAHGRRRVAILLLRPGALHP